MKRDDDALGMNRPISRRDFVHGVTLAAGGAALPGWTGSAKAAVRAGEGASVSTQAAFDPAGAGRDYPPERLGLRGSHPGSFEAAHALRDRPRKPWRKALLIAPAATWSRKQRSARI